MLQIVTDKLKHEHMYTITLGQWEPSVSVRFTLLNWREYKALSELLSFGFPGISIEEIIWDRCVLDPALKDPATWDKMNAGVIATVSSVILYLSGSSTLDDLNVKLSRHRDNILVDPIQQITMFICRAMPAYKPEDFEDMPWPKVLTRLAQAEKILIDRGEIQSQFKWLPPEEAEALKQTDFTDDNKGIAEI